jgi:hypothetical protein
LSTLLEEAPTTFLRKEDRAQVHVVLPRWVLVFLSLAVVLPWAAMGAFFAWRHDSSGPTAPSSTASVPASDTLARPTPQEWFPAKDGSWGKLESILFAIDLPDEYVYVPSESPPIRWCFPGFSKEQVLAKLKSLGLPEDELKKLDSEAKWSTQDGATAVEPGDRLILILTPEVREKLYAILVTFPQNARQIDPIWFRPGEVDWRLEEGGLAASSVALLKKLLYRQGQNLLLFADFEPALRSLPNDAERRRFMKTISRKRTVLARVKLDANTDVEKLSQYWGVGGRRKDLLPFLNALHRVEKDASSNLVCLLPEFPRDHLYCHPYASGDDKGVKQDCFWSAFNFFSDQPDNRFNDMTYVDEVLRRDYYPIQEPTQLGDLILVTVGGKSVIHAANYVADDLVFTKNGEDFRQPWLLMHMADMLDTYAVKYPNAETLQPKFFRKKGI